MLINEEKKKKKNCNDIPLFSSCYSIIGLFEGLAVSFLLRHSVGVITFCEPAFRLSHLVGLDCSINFFVTQLCKNSNFFELGVVYIIYGA